MIKWAFYLRFLLAIEGLKAHSLEVLNRYVVRRLPICALLVVGGLLNLNSHNCLRPVSDVDTTLYKTGYTITVCWWYKNIVYNLELLLELLQPGGALVLSPLKVALVVRQLLLLLTHLQDKVYFNAPRKRWSTFLSKTSSISLSILFSLATCSFCSSSIMNRGFLLGTWWGDY